jgi:hypothetical protein
MRAGAGANEIPEEETMRKTMGLAAVMAVFGFVSVARAEKPSGEGKAAAPMAKKGPGEMKMPSGPPPELKQLDFFIGEWTCAGHSEESPMGPAHDTHADLSIKWILGGMWQMGEYTEKKTEQSPMPMQSMDIFGYDAANKQFVLHGLNGMGGWSMGHSKGFEGDSITYEMEMHMGGQTMMGRATFTKMKGGSEMGAKFMSKIKDKWVPMGGGNCKKK